MYQQTHINASPTQNIGKLTGIVILKPFIILILSITGILGSNNI